LPDSIIKNSPFSKQLGAEIQKLIIPLNLIKSKQERNRAEERNYKEEKEKEVVSGPLVLTIR
jgi:hypothetical protein